MFHFRDVRCFSVMLSDFAWFLYVCLDDFCGFGGLKGHFQGVYGQIGAVSLLVHCLSTT